MAAFVGDVAENLVKGWLGECVFSFNVFRGISCVAVVNREAEFVLLRNFPYRAMDFARVVYRVPCPPLLVPNFGAKDVCLNRGADYADGLYYLKLDAARASRAKERGRVPPRVLVLEGAGFRAANVRRDIGNAVCGPL